MNVQTVHSAASLQWVCFNEISPRAKKFVNIRLPFGVDMLHWSEFTLIITTIKTEFIKSYYFILHQTVVSLMIKTDKIRMCVFDKFHMQQ